MAIFIWFVLMFISALYNLKELDREGCLVYVGGMVINGIIYAIVIAVIKWSFTVVFAS